MTLDPICTDPDSPVLRLRRGGVDALSDTELLSLLLGDRDPDRAASLLRAHEGLRGVARAGRGVLAARVGERRAARVTAALEVARRVMCASLAPEAPYRTSRDVVRAYGPRLADAPEESVLVVVLDARHRPVAERVIARGTATACAAVPRQVFALAVREAGAAVLVVHNHPSGDPTPSAEDLTFTRKLADAGALLDVPLVDHVVVGREGSFSFLDAGLLGRREP